MLRWEPIPYKPRQGYIADCALGRFMIQRSGSGMRTFDLFLNGVRSARAYRKPDDLKAIAQRIVNAKELTP